MAKSHKRADTAQQYQPVSASAFHHLREVTTFKQEDMRMRKKRMKLWGLLLSVTLMMTQLPAVAMAENNTVEDGVSASFPVSGDSSNASIATPGQADEVITDEIEKETGKEIGKNTGGGGIRQKQSGRPGENDHRLDIHRR